MNNIKDWYYPDKLNTAVGSVVEVLESGFVNEGKVSKEFAARLASYLGREYGFCMPSGTLSLCAALQALNLSSGSKVAIPAFSFIATANAVKSVGLEPVFIDIESDRFLISEPHLEKALQNNGIDAVITVEVNGRSPNYENVNALSEKYGFTLITDSAESLGSKSGSTMLGKFGKMSIISLSPNKVITSGQGGGIFTDDPELAQALLAVKLQGNHVRGDGGSDKYYRVGSNYKFTDLQAALGLDQLQYLDSRLAHISELNDWYVEILQDRGLVAEYNLSFPEVYAGETLLWVDVMSERKSDFVKFLSDKNVGYRDFWVPMPHQESYGYSYETFPNSALVCSKGLWLASNFNITKDDIWRAFK